MANRKWKLFEYEYDVVEFIISFGVAFFIGYFTLVSFAGTLSLANTVEADFVWALAVGIIWTYSRAHGLFSGSDRTTK